MPESKKQAMIVTLSDKRSIHDVARDLRDAGFDVEQILEETNIVTGSAPASARKRLQGIEGVEDVSGDNPVDIGPPGAPVS
jgi:hypothetical protein